MAEILHEEVELEDFEYDEDTETYSYPCPCGDIFNITREQLKNGEDIARCPSCSLIIKVIYELEQFEELETIKTTSQKTKDVQKITAIVLKSQQTVAMGLLRVSPKATKRLMKIVDRYNAFLKKRFPIAYETQDAVFRGFRQLFHDAGIYAVLMNDRYYGKSLNTYKRAELELMWSFPTDMVKILPTMAILALPFSTFVVIPLLVLYPRIMSPPFWTNDQIKQFFTRDMVQRSLFYHRVLQDVEKSLPLLDSKRSEEAVKLLEALICQVSYGMCVEPARLVEQPALKQAFRQFPFAVPYMRWRYAYDLLRLHGLHLLPFYNMYALFRPRTVLFRYASFMRNMDLAIAREGLQSLSDDDLNRACFMRCLTPFNAGRQAKEHFLDKWLSYTVGEQKSDASPSLYLHLPIFWSYMQRENAQLFRHSVPK